MLCRISCGHIEKGEEALNYLWQTQEDSLHTSRQRLHSLLKACAKLKWLERGREAHIQIANKRYDKDLFLGSTLLDMYAKCGSLGEALQVFNVMPVRDVVLWTTLIRGYTDHGLFEDALNCFENMKSEGVSPNAYTFVCSLKASSCIGALSTVQSIHAQIVIEELETDLFIGNTLVDVYAKCGLLKEAQEVFDDLMLRNVVSWTALISGYLDHGLAEQALDYLEKMQLVGFILDAGTIICGLKACGSIGAIGRGQVLHSEIAKDGFETDLYIGSALVFMYAKCGLVTAAQEVFDELPVRDNVTWTALIAGYAEGGEYEKVLSSFQRMEVDTRAANDITYAYILKACTLVGAASKGQEFHTKVVIGGFDSNPFVGNVLVAMYARIGSVSEAHTVLDKLSVRDVFSWNALIDTYVEHGFGEKALNLLKKMRVTGVHPDAVTYVCSLRACGSIGASQSGQELHVEIVKEGLGNGHGIGNTLVDTYAKCGLMAEAHEVFDELVLQDAVAWSALIQGYSCLGENNIVLALFREMSLEGIFLDEVLGLSLLSVCSHTGLVNEGMLYFEALSKEHGVTPTIEHHNYMVDLLGRAGRPDDAVGVLQTMPLEPDAVMWITVLDAYGRSGSE